MSLSRARLRTVAGLGASALVAASLTLVGGGAAQAAPVDSTFNWGVSSYVDGHLTSQTFGDGASEASNGVVNFTGGEGRTDTGTGVTTAQYEGWARYGFVNGTTEYYSITFEDPAVTVDEDGHGEVVADVAWTIFPSTTGGVEDAVVATFDVGASGWNGYNLTATPHWANGVETGSTDYDSAKPALTGESWTYDFVMALPKSLRGLFYASGAAADADKAPAQFVAAVPGPKITVTDSTVTADEIAFMVSGTGFTPVTKPGDAGVYVGLAPAGGLPNVSSIEQMSAFAAAAYVVPAQINDGSFAAALHADESTMIAGTEYSIYTWQAHSHSNTTQDTETPVAIDWSALGATTIAPVVTAPTTMYGKAATVSVSVPGASGTVTLTGLGTAQTASLSSGSASFQVPAGLAAGSHALAVSYSGEFTHFPSTKSASLTVTKLGSKTAVKVTKKPTAKKAGQATVTVTGAAAGDKVVVTVKGKGAKTAKKTVKLNAAGKATVKLAKAGKKSGQVTVTAVYAGDANHATSSGKASYKVAKVKKAMKAKKK